MLAISLLVLFSPGSAVPSGPPNSDKLVHFLLFAALALTSRLAGIGMLASIAWVLAYAALSEVLQTLLPIQRSGSLWDVVADAAGMAVGLAVYAVFTRARKRYSAG